MQRHKIWSHSNDTYKIQLEIQNLDPNKQVLMQSSKAKREHEQGEVTVDHAIQEHFVERAGHELQVRKKYASFK